MKKNKIHYLVFVILLSLFSCEGNRSDPSDSGNPDSGSQFDRKAMFAHWADHFIIPATENFTSKITDLDAKAASFAAAPDTKNLKEARDALHEAMKAYQYIGFYRFGKAEEITVNFQYRMNTYPTNTKRIIENAKQRNHAFTKLSEIQGGNISQGLPAIDFLLNGFGGSDAEILDKYTSDADAPLYKEYLMSLTKEMLRTSTEVLRDWKGGYRQKFIENTSSNATGTMSLVVNAYVQYYEKELRAGKFGYPVGILTPMFLPLDNSPKPELLESRFAPDRTKEYALLGIKAMQEFFDGKGVDGTSGNSLSEYLRYLNKKQSQQNLDQKINAAFAESEAKINVLNGNFKTEIQQNLNKMKEAYAALQKNVPLLKVDMAQSLNITISYMDTDGD